MNQDPQEQIPQPIIEETKSFEQDPDPSLTENHLLLQSLEKSQFDSDLIYALPMQKLTQFLQWTQKDKKSAVTKSVVKTLMAKENKEDFSNELYIQMMKSFCTSRSFDEVKTLFELMEKVKPLNEFADDSYGLNTLIEASLKITKFEQAYELFEKRKEISNSNTFISLIKFLSYEPDSQEKILKLLEESKQVQEFEQFFNSLLESLNKGKHFELMGDLINREPEVKIQT